METTVTDVEVVVEARATPGEGPVWDGRAGVLWWVDIMGCAVHRYDPASGVDRELPLDTMVGAVIPREGGGLVAAIREGFAFVDETTGALERIHSLGDTTPPVRMNDGKCDPRGRFFAGTMGLLGEPSVGALYRLDPGGSVQQLVADVGISNGLDWSDDEQTMYYIDSYAGGVDAFDYDVASGAISRRRRIIEISRTVGLADGMTLDAHGCIWVAIHGASCVRRYSPEGEALGEIRLPVDKVTSCAFGGSDLGDLYITTAATRMSPAELEAQPLAGSLFRCRPGVTGRPAHRFAG